MGTCAKTHHDLCAAAQTRRNRREAVDGLKRRLAPATIRSSSCSFVEVGRVGGREVPDAADEVGAIASGSRAMAIELLEAVGVGQLWLAMTTWQRATRELGVRPRGRVPAC